MANIQHSALTGADLHVTKLHATTHESGATDPIPIDKLSAPIGTTELDVSITNHGLCPVLPNDSSKFLNGVGAYTVPGGVPTGAMVMWMTETPPAGWLECNGASVLRATYGGLFTVIGTKYGNVDGSHFNLPDMRGYFARGWDHGAAVDPDKATRTDRGDGTTGDHIGTKETFDVESHAHRQKGYISGGGAPSKAPESAADAQGVLSLDYFTYGVEGYAGKTANETRPININVMFIIKT